MNSNFFGAGIGYRRRYHQALLDTDENEKPAILEIIPGHFFGEPETLTALGERYPLIFHEVGFSLATAGDVDKEILERVQSLVQFAKPILFSEHLAMTSSPEGIDLGHLAPLWYTREALDLVVDRVRRWQDTLDLPIAIENITAPFVIPDADMTEAEFFCELTYRTGCGLLLDLTNLLINGRNFGFDPFERLSSYPIHSVMQVHLAGGRRQQDWWVDSHSEPIEQTSLALLAFLRDKLEDKTPLRAIIVERDDSLPPLGELFAEAKRAGELWEKGKRQK